METYTLKADPRDVLKKKVRRLRSQGYLPAAIYGYKGNFNVQLNEKDFTKVYLEAGHTGVVDVLLEGKKHNVLIDEVQMNPVTRGFTHVSLRELRMDEEITAEVPLTLVGAEESLAVKEEESLVILSQTTIEVKGLPRDLPQEVTIDVSGFHAGDTIILKDIKLPEGVVLVYVDEEELNVTIVTTTSAIQEEIIENVDEAIAEAVAEGEEQTAEEGEAGATASEEKKEQ